MRAALLVLMILVVTPRADAQPTPAPLTLAVLEGRALEGHPALVRAAAAIEASRGRARQAGTLPNPTIGYTAEEVSGGPTIRGGEHGFFVEQAIPLGGKLKLSRQAFALATTEAEARHAAERQRILLDVRRRYHEAAIAARRVTVREELAALAAEAVVVSRQLVNVGAADRPDLLDIEIEDQQARLRLAEARSMQVRIWRELAAAVADPALTRQPLAGDPESGLPALTEAAVIARLLEGSPEVIEARAAHERAQVVLQRARKEPLPDLRLRGGPRYNRELLESSPRGPLPVGWEAAFEVGVTVPLFDRNQGNIAAARQEVVRAAQDRARLELALRARAAAVLERYDNAVRIVETYRAEVLPRAEEAHRLYLARYREMAAAYPQVLIARRTLIQARERHLDALDAAWQASVEIEGYLLDGGLAARPRADF